MKPFSIYQHPAIGFVAVKQGFSWPGFFFSGIWLMVKRLWKYALVVYMLMLILQLPDLLSKLSIDEADMLLPLQILVLPFFFVVAFVVGKKGNEWRERDLEKKGFQFISTTLADSPQKAIAQANESSKDVNPSDKQSRISNVCETTH